MRQLLDAVSYMKEHGVVHGNLIMENMLLDKHFNLKIGDFGFAYTFEGHPQRGNSRMLAPERASAESYDVIKSEVYSCGILLFMMVMGTYPLHSLV